MASSDLQKEIAKLTPIQTERKKFILENYPSLDEMFADTIVRLTDEEADHFSERMRACAGINSPPSADDPEKYSLQTVTIE